MLIKTLNRQKFESSLDDNMENKLYTYKQTKQQRTDYHQVRENVMINPKKILRHDESAEYVL